MSEPQSPYAAVLIAPFGALGIRVADQKLLRIEFLPPASQPQTPRCPISEQITNALERCLDDPRQNHGLALPKTGTNFQRRVWAEIAAIPCGQTRTYGEIAKRINSAARAVGQACGANPYPVLVPCHRVVGQGDLGGFSNARGGFLLEAKRWLLAREQR